MKLDLGDKRQKRQVAGMLNLTRDPSLVFAAHSGFGAGQYPGPVVH